MRCGRDGVDGGRDKGGWGRWVSFVKYGRLGKGVNFCSSDVTGCVVEDTVPAGEEQGTSAGGEIFGVEAAMFAVGEQN